MGYLLPGKPVANMCFRVYGSSNLINAISFLSDFKLGHYMKVPPRTMFAAQVAGHQLTSIFLVFSQFTFRDLLYLWNVRSPLMANTPQELEILQNSPHLVTAFYGKMACRSVSKWIRLLKSVGWPAWMLTIRRVRATREWFPVSLQVFFGSSVQCWDWLLLDGHKCRYLFSLSSPKLQICTSYSSLSWLTFLKN